MRKNHKVDLFIVGQPKSGTTALAHFLGQHPDICMSQPKEPGYFATDLIRESDEFHGGQLYFHIRTPEQYRALFKHAANEKIFGEASTNYLYSKEAAKNIHKYNPDAKIVILLREPVSFLHSLHMQYVNEAAEDKPDFAAALAAEPERKKGRGVPKAMSCPSYLYYSERAKYAQQVKRYTKFFPESQIFVATTEQLRLDSAGTYKKLLGFLGVDKNFRPEFKNIHESKKPRFGWLHKRLHNPRLKRIAHQLLGERLFMLLQKRIVERLLLKKSARQPLSDKQRAELSAQLSKEVKDISKLLHRDFATEWGYKESQTAV